MSNPGLYSSVYQQIREYAALVDMVLISLKENPESADTHREQLSRLLADLANPEQTDLSLRIVAIMFGSETGSRKTWQRLSQALRNTQFERTVIHDLEQFAQVLEEKQADALAKMRGWSK